MSKKILFIGAHPDDVEFGCGGIVIKEVAKGNVVKIIVLSKGEAGTHGTGEIREQEARDAAKLVGAEIDFLDFGGDSHLQHSPAYSIQLAKEFRIFKPNIVIAIDPYENQHPDHSASGKLARDASRLARYKGVPELAEYPINAIEALYFYRVTIDPEPDIIIDITEYKDKWDAAMRCHKSQMATRDYVALRGTISASLGMRVGVKYAMGLRSNDPIVVDSPSDILAGARNF
jgi:LmbE family N-acetylglucosaminyl deacetylase